MNDKEVLLDNFLLDCPSLDHPIYKNSFTYESYSNVLWFKFMMKMGFNSEHDLTRWIIVRYYIDKPYEEGSFIGGSQIIWDTLKKLGHIKEDTNKYLKTFYIQKKTELKNPQFSLFKCPCDDAVEAVMDYIENA